MGNKKKKTNLAPKKILKKPKHNKKGAPPKRCNSPIGRVGCPPLTRFLPDICNGKTSTKACQERAIAFSQRQMQDIESIAVKLMTELKSMKDIVEEKLFHETYRCTSMKNDADEVKSAIKSTTRVEETTKKWLSVMARDCNRFCKFMGCSCSCSHSDYRSKPPKRFTSIRSPKIHGYWHYSCSLHCLTIDRHCGCQNCSKIKFGACRSFVPFRLRICEHFGCIFQVYNNNYVI